MESIYPILDAIEQDGLRSALATIIRVEGSAYRKEGTSMLFLSDGRQIGLLSAGCLEQDLAAHAAEVWTTGRSHTVIYDMSAEDDLSWGHGAGCNGIIHILLEPVDEWLREQLLLLKARLAAGEPVLAVRRLSPDFGTDRLAFFTGGGASFGHELPLAVQASLGQEPRHASQASLNQEPRHASQAILGQELRQASQASLGQELRPASQTSLNQELRPASQARLNQEPRYASQASLGQEPRPASKASLGQEPHSPLRGEFGAWTERQRGGKALLLHTEQAPLFLQRYDPKPRLIVFGAGPDAGPLAAAASRTGFAVTVCDWREALCSKEHFPMAEQCMVGAPTELAAAVRLGPRDAVVLMTHHFRHDQALLRVLLRREPFYLGVLGPRRRTSRLLGTDDIPANLHSPAGLAIGAEGPEEIAISIIAEIIGKLRQGNRESNREGNRERSRAAHVRTSK